MKIFLYNLATDKYKGFFASLIKFFLFLLSLIYWLLVKFLIFFNRRIQYRLPCKVVSVGNIIVGGTGKTTLVEFIARFLKNKGHKVAILSRGYKRQAPGYKLQATSYKLMGDEPYMLQMKLKDIPIIVDTDRIRAANRAVKDFHADTVILDDGFQQWKIVKDLEIVTIAAKNPFGNRRLLPAGILREPRSSLKRADIFVLTKTDLNANTDSIKTELNMVNPEGIIFESVHKPVGFYNINNIEELLGADFLKAKTVTLFCGIGDPGSFENLIAGLKINIGLFFRFTDHYHYARQDLEKIINASRDKDIDTIVTTEKDFARIAQMRIENKGSQIFVLRVELVIKDEQRFYNRLLKLYSD
jgi:tetraacyldisaccharide 4'-kinase